MIRLCRAIMLLSLVGCLTPGNRPTSPPETEEPGGEAGSAGEAGAAGKATGSAGGSGGVAGAAGAAGKGGETQGGAGGTPAKCIPGQSFPCTCTSGQQGAQVCNAQGSGLEPCACAGGSGGGGSGAGGQGSCDTIVITGTPVATCQNLGKTCASCFPDEPFYLSCQAGQIPSDPKCKGMFDYNVSRLFCCPSP